MGQVLKSVFIVFCAMLLLMVPVCAGQPYSYIYIQGDKTAPFYVKMEGKMQPRYGKNYCIISELTPGTVNIEILFQQNVYPAEKFTIVVPENGARGFLLDKHKDGYALYDLQKKDYIMPGEVAK